MNRLHFKIEVQMSLKMKIIPKEKITLDIKMTLRRKGISHVKLWHSTSASLMEWYFFFVKLQS